MLHVQIISVFDFLISNCSDLHRIYLCKAKTKALTETWQNEHRFMEDKGSVFRELDAFVYLSAVISFTLGHHNLHTAKIIPVLI